MSDDFGPSPLREALGTLMDLQAEADLRAEMWRRHIRVEYTNEPWNWYPLPPPRWVRVKEDGPASTPPVNRHFWERDR